MEGTTSGTPHAWPEHRLGHKHLGKGGNIHLNVILWRHTDYMSIFKSDTINIH